MVKSYFVTTRKDISQTYQLELSLIIFTPRAISRHIIARVKAMGR